MVGELPPLDEGRGESKDACDSYYLVVAKATGLVTHARSVPESTMS